MNVDFKVHKADAIFLVPGGDEYIEFRAGMDDPENWARVRANGEFERGDGYSEELLAARVGVVLAQQSPEGFVAATSDGRMGFAVKPNGDFAFIDCEPAPGARSFIDALASAYTVALSKKGRAS